MLTAKQEAFCLAYLVEPDASAAYRKSYNAVKSSDASVRSKAAALLANGNIAARIATLRGAAAAVAVVEEADILREAARLALSDPIGLFGENGDMLPIAEMSPAMRACIASVEIDNRVERDPDDPTKMRSFTVKKVKLWDKNSAIEKMMKHLGSFERDNAQRAGANELLKLLRESRERTVAQATVH